MKNLSKILRDKQLYVGFLLSETVIWTSFNDIYVRIPQMNEKFGHFKIPYFKLGSFEKISFDGEFLHLDGLKIGLEPTDERFERETGADHGADIDIDIKSLKWLNRAVCHPSKVRKHLEYLWINPARLIATDGHRLHRQQRETAEKHPEYAIPRDIALDIAKLPFRSISIKSLDWTAKRPIYSKTFSAICDGYTVEFWDLKQPEECPPYEQIIPKNTEESFAFETKNFVKWLKKHKKIVDGCLMTVKRDRLSAVIQKADVSVIEHFDLIDSTFSEWEPFIFMINVNYLIDTLDGTDFAIFSFEDRNNLNPVKVEIARQKKTAVLMPMRF